MSRSAVLVIAVALSWLAAQPLAQSVSVTYFIADGSNARGFRAGDRQLALWALEDWQRAAPRIRIEPANEQDALVRVYWTEPNQARYGEMQPLKVHGRAGAAVFIQADASLLGDDIAGHAASDPLFRESVVYLTCLHELGHALGLVHTPDSRDIMYFFGYGGDVVDYFNRYRVQLRARGDIAAVSGLSDGDRRRLAAAVISRSAVK
jgi:Matrixin